MRGQASGLLGFSPVQNTVSSAAPRETWSVRVEHLWNTWDTKASKQKLGKNDPGMTKICTLKNDEWKLNINWPFLIIGPKIGKRK